MPKRAPFLSDLQVRRLKWAVVQSGPNKGKPRTALHAVGGVGGLYLQCTPPVGDNKNFGRSWLLKYTIGARKREAGLGPYPDVTLGMARDEARLWKQKVREGLDPLEERRAARSERIRQQAKAKTFKEIGRLYEARKAKEFKTAKQSQKLNSHLETYAYPIIGQMLVADIERSHILSILTPHWETKTETMKRVRAAVERILDLAGVQGLRAGDNPARWKGNLDLELAAPEKIAPVKHYKALPVSELQDFVGKLRKKKTTGAQALYFAILTASRSGEVRGATWDEIDLSTKTWTIPGERMKGGRTHRVPLTTDAMRMLRALPRDYDFVFPSPRGGKLSDMALTKVIKDLGYQVTQHGFRATFRTWAQDSTEYAEEVCELALAHVNSDGTRAAYARSELLDKRRLLMRDWQKFCRPGLAR